MLHLVDEKYMLPMAQTRHDADYIFQQDNSPIQTSRSSMKWFTRTGVSLFPWPSNSPDLNPVENLWIVLTRPIYENYICYSTVS